MPSDATIQKLESLQESAEDDADEEEGEGTAKAGEQNGARSPAPMDSPKTVEKRGLVTQARLSSMFEGWLQSPPPTTAVQRSSVVRVQDKRKSVSEPKLIKPTTSDNQPASSDEETTDEVEVAFEEMLVRTIL